MQMLCNQNLQQQKIISNGMGMGRPMRRSWINLGGVGLLACIAPKSASSWLNFCFPTLTNRSKPSERGNLHVYKAFLQNKKN